MIYYMDSKTFQNEFLVNETDKDILNAQYILVSTNIRKRTQAKNIITGYRYFYPNNAVFMCTNEDQMKDEYFNQLDTTLPFIATLILGAIEEKYMIIFLCTKNETKLNYLEWFSDYVYTVFDYPVYDYKAYTNWCELIEFDKEAVAKKCRKTLKRASEINYNKNIQSKKGRKVLESQISQYSKKELKKQLKKRGLYSPNLTKEEMREFLMLNL